MYKGERVLFLNLNYHPELALSPVYSLWLGSSMDLPGTEGMGQTLSILYVGSVWRTRGFLLPSWRWVCSVDPRLKVRLTKLNPGIIVFLNYIARNGNHTPQDTSLFLTVSKEAFWCSRRSLEALWTDGSRKMCEEANDQSYKIWRRGDVASYHVVWAPAVLVPILVSSLTSNQRESKSLKNTENENCFLRWKKAPSTRNRLQIRTCQYSPAKIKCICKCITSTLILKTFNHLFEYLLFLKSISESIF